MGKKAPAGRVIRCTGPLHAVRKPTYIGYWRDGGTAGFVSWNEKGSEQGSEPQAQLVLGS